MVLYIGNHTSSSKGYAAMGRQMVKNGGNTFAFFTRNPRGGKAKEIDPADVEKFLELAREIMADDLKRMEYTPGNYYNFHPGSHVGQGIEAGIAKIAEILNDVLTEEQSTTVLLETMSGKGSEVGSTFQELKEIIDRVERKDKLGVCLDTCHIWDGGYDIVHDLDGVLTEFDQVIGLTRLKAVHLNDSMNGLGSHKDRHAKIGEGEIGLDALVEVVCHPALKGVPFILETPNDDEGWKREITLLRERYAMKGD